MTNPDFIIIGAMKCGTSTLAAQLGAQPGMFMTDPKEPNYFSDDAVFAQGPDWYSALFDAAAPGDIKGEASTHYTKLPDYPQTLPRLLAAGLTGDRAPKLIYMIRNPVVRLVSHYIHEWSEGVLSDTLQEAVQNHAPLVDYGRYGYQIAPFVEAYGAKAILLTSLEQLKADKNGELARISAFLGHKAPAQWCDDLGRENVSADRVRRLPMQALLVDNPLATFLRRTLVPKALRTRIRQSRQMQHRPEIPAHQRLELEARFAADRDVLAAIFPGAPALEAAYPFLKT